MKSKLFFAHSQKTFDTPEEKAARIRISTGFELFCPNEQIYQKNNQATNADYNKGIDDCGGLVFLPYKGYVGKGVYSNILYALRSKYPVFVYDAKDDVLRSVTSVTINDLNDWAIRYATWTEE